MITLHILKLLEDNGFGVVQLTGSTPNATLFFEKLPSETVGIYIRSRGTPQNRGKRTTQAFDLYARGKDDLDGALQLEAISEFFDSIYGTTCSLPILPEYSESEYKNVMIQPTSSINNLGADSTDRLIYQTSGQITYSK